MDKTQRFAYHIINTLIQAKGTKYGVLTQTHPYGQQALLEDSISVLEEMAKMEDGVQLHSNISDAVSAVYHAKDQLARQLEKPALSGDVFQHLYEMGVVLSEITNIAVRHDPIIDIHKLIQDLKAAV